MPTKFKNLEQGTIFKNLDDVYIKVEEGRNGDDAPFNSVCLTDGTLEWFMSCADVIAETSARLVFD